MTSTIFGIRSNISPKLLELVTSNLVSSFDCRVLRHVYYGAVRLAILATAWLLVETVNTIIASITESGRLGYSRYE